MGVDFRRPRRTTVHARTGTNPRDPNHERTVTIASASIVRPSQIRRSTRKVEWQEEAWRFRRTVPELGFAVRWISKALSRCNLFIGEMPESGVGDPIPAKNPPQLALDLLADLHGGPAGQRAAMRRMAVHLSVPGETYSIRVDPPASDPDAGYRWYVASDREFTNKGGKATLRLPDDGTTIELDLDPETANAQAIRLWQQDDEYAWEADSSIRPNLGVLGVIEGLHRRIKVDIDSRLAGAGVLVVPNSASMPNPKQSESDAGEELHPDPFVDSLMHGMIIPIQDPDDVSAVVPLVIKVPDEAVGKIQHLSFATKFDEKLIDNLEANLKRFAIGADLPAEIVTGGLADANHWSGWLIDETGIRLYVAPLGGVIASGWTTEYLLPGLRAGGVQDAERWVIGLDTSELEQRPNKSTEANTLHDKGRLSDAALLRENGFGEEDLPRPMERQRWLAERIVIAHPEFLPALAPILGFPVVSFPESGDGSGGNELEGPGDSSRDEIPEQESQPPAIGASAGDAFVWMVNACESVVVRAMEVAGKRLLNSGGRANRHRTSPGRQVQAWNVHTTLERPLADAGLDKLLAGAWTSLEAVLPEQQCIRDALDTYCRALLMSGEPHSRRSLVKVLSYAGCIAA
jgi:hypothetical protein